MKHTNIEQLDFIRRVHVKTPPQHIMDAGNDKSRLLFENPLCGFTCGDNSISVREAMRERGEIDWQVVAGYAFAPKQRIPTAHVWVRHGPTHYDPTWVLWEWTPERLRYYELVEPLLITKNDSLAPLRRIAVEHGLALTET